MSFNVFLEEENVMKTRTRAVTIRRVKPVDPRTTADVSFEQRLKSTFAAYGEDFPSDAFPSFLEARDFEQLMGGPQAPKRS